MDFKTQPILSVERGENSLQSYFSKVYGYMANALAVSSVCAYLVTKEPLINLFYTATANGVSYSLLGWLSIFAPLILIYFIHSSATQLNVQKTKIFFFVFSALMGVSLSNAFLLYTSASAFQAFLVTAGSFLGLSIYAKTTTRDMTPMGSFLSMGVIGLLLTMVVNIFLKSSFLTMAVSVIGVVIFAGLVIYDTQKLKQMHYMSSTSEEKEVSALRGALSLYLDFINLFWFILSFMGDRK